MNNHNNYIVVDDDPTNNLICEYTIKKFNRNAQIKVFTNPESALEELSKASPVDFEDHPVILFLDINMPTLSGWEFLEIFQQLDQMIQDNISIFILSSSIEDFSEQGQKFPFIKGFLSKPLKIDNLNSLF